MYKDIENKELEVLSLPTVKDFIRVDHEDEDQLVADLIVTARTRIEDYIGASLLERAQQFCPSETSTDCLFINRYPVKAITRIFIQSDEGETDFLLEEFDLNLSARPARIRRKSGGRFDALIPDNSTLLINFIAGFGAETEDVPMPLRHAVLVWVAHLYEHRERDTEVMPLRVNALLVPYRGVRL